MYYRTSLVNFFFEYYSWYAAITMQIPSNSTDNDHFENIYTDIELDSILRTIRVLETLTKLTRDDWCKYSLLLVQLVDFGDNGS